MIKITHLFPSLVTALFLAPGFAAPARGLSAPPAAPSFEVNLRHTGDAPACCDMAAGKDDADDDAASGEGPARHHWRAGHGDDQIAFFSDNHVAAGKTVRGAAVAIGGNLVVDGRVDGDAVVIGGNLTLGPKARIGGDAVCVGGALHRDPGAEVGGRAVVRAFGGRCHGCLPLRIVCTRGLHSSWIWFANLMMLPLYALVALIFPTAIRRVGDTFAERPGFSLLAAFLSVLALPVVFVLLLVTIIGIPLAILVLPVCVVGLMMFGKASFYALIGRRISRDRLHPSVAVLAGGAICLALFAIPLAGPALSLLIPVVMMGAGIVAVSSSRKKPSAPPQGGPPVIGAAS